MDEVKIKPTEHSGESGTTTTQHRAKSKFRIGWLRAQTAAAAAAATESSSSSRHDKEDDKEVEHKHTLSGSHKSLKPSTTATQKLQPPTKVAIVSRDDTGDGFALSDAALEQLRARGMKDHDLVSRGSFIPRHHPYLVQVVEELGDRCGFGGCRLVVESFNSKYDNAYSIETIGNSNVEYVRFAPERRTHNAALRINLDSLKTLSAGRLRRQLRKLSEIAKDAQHQRNAMMHYGYGPTDFHYSGDQWPAPIPATPSSSSSLSSSTPISTPTEAAKQTVAVSSSAPAATVVAAAAAAAPVATGAPAPVVAEGAT